MTYRLNKKQIEFFNKLELKKQLKEISSDYNEITSYLDENLILQNLHNKN